MIGEVNEGRGGFVSPGFCSALWQEYYKGKKHVISLRGSGGISLSLWKITQAEGNINLWKLYHRRQPQSASHHARWMIGQENLIAVALSRSLCPRTIIINGRRADPINLLSHTQKFKLASTFLVFLFRKLRRFFLQVIVRLQNMETQRSKILCFVRDLHSSVCSLFFCSSII